MEKEIDKIIKNPNKASIIRKSHAIRLDLLRSIQQADVQKVKNLLIETTPYLEADKIDLFKRVEGNELRSLKNFTLSHNSLYALYAELGGLDPVLSHYMSEKYAIIIETTENKHNLKQLHKEFLIDYTSPKNRIPINKKEFLSKKVDHYITVHFMNPISIQELADHFFVTKEHLMRTYKKETHSTIQKKIQDIRLTESCQLLEHTNLTITTIALMVGFNSSQYFSKVFKEEYGCSPTEYREEKNNS